MTKLSIGVGILDPFCSISKVTYALKLYLGSVETFPFPYSSI